MLRWSNFRVGGGAAVLAAVVCGPACMDIISAERFIDREEKRFTVSGKPDVSLSTFDGSIEIRPSDRQEVAVTIEKQAHDKEAASRIEVRAEQNGNRIVVDVRLPKTQHVFGFHESAGARLIVSLPAASNIEAHRG